MHVMHSSDPSAIQVTSLIKIRYARLTGGTRLFGGSLGYDKFSATIVADTVGVSATGVAAAFSYAAEAFGCGRSMMGLAGLFLFLLLMFCKEEGGRRKFLSSMLLLLP